MRSLGNVALVLVIKRRRRTNEQQQQMRDAYLESLLIRSAQETVNATNREMGWRDLYCYSSLPSATLSRAPATHCMRTTMTSTQQGPILSTGSEVRQAAKLNTITLTSGLAPSYLQANLIVLPSRHAQDFRLLCQRNPVPCPLLAESAYTGSYAELKSYIPGIPGWDLASAVDIRNDAPRYMIYRQGRLTCSHVPSIEAEWTDDHVAFLIGCSYSFETALAAHDLVPRHMLMNRNVAMYRTNIPLCPAGIFVRGTCVVSMRPYNSSQIEAVRSITRPFVLTHGEPVAYGWDAVRALGISDIHTPEWGDAPLSLDGGAFGGEDVPVFWGCGVTPQLAVMCAGLDAMAHAPGHMIVLDVKDEDVFEMPDLSSES